MLLKISKLNKSFGSNQIFQDFDFEIANLGLKIIVGNNGCGKSTLFNILSGFVLPDSGKVIFDAISLKNLEPYQIARLGIARTFQNGGLFKDLTVEENLILTIQSQQKMSFLESILPINKKKYKIQINDILQEIDLLEYKFQKVSILSTGQARLLELKKLEIQKAKLYLIDEPTAGVNHKMFPKIYELIMRLNQKSAVLIIEHNRDFIKLFDCEVVELKN
jgi:ABC-type branched-subunit amino acid transport system ATPase component